MEFAPRSADRTSLAWRAALVFAACVAAGLSFAPNHSSKREHVSSSPGLRPGVDTASTSLRLAALSPGEAGNCNGGEIAAPTNEPTAYQSRLKEEVQQLLAQGGCPGWIALAGEADIVSAGQREAEVMHDDAVVGAAAAGEATLTQLPPVGDELISEQDDLLRTSPEIQRTKESAAASPPRGSDDACACHSSQGSARRCADNAARSPCDAISEERC